VAPGEATYGAASDSREIEPRHSTRHALAVLLAINSGATDAFGFLALGGAFTSVMTGNMVLLGAAAGRRDSALATNAAMAIVSFVLGCAAGTALAGTAAPQQPVWPSRVNRALLVELVLIAAQAVGWWCTAASPDLHMHLVLLSLNAAALGIQSSAVQRFGVSGLSTTYMTGTLTTLVIRLVSERSVRSVAASAQLLGGLIGGAAVMAVLVRHLPGTAPVLQLTVVIAVLLAARTLFARRD
jgi:uncharacterized membrane protein YoaK (UPF0700 family)